MAGRGMDILAGEDYLDPEERVRRSVQKQRQAIARGLTPDWFVTPVGGRRIWCLRSGLRIAVVGAGFAGLWAAWYLQRCGAEVTVYEATNRVGGRVLTDHNFISGKVTEAGAELIGENHPLWMILAARAGFVLVPLTEDDDYHRRGLDVRMRFGTHDLTAGEKSAMERSLLTLLLKIGAEGKGISETEPWMSPTPAEARRLDRTTVKANLDRLLPASTPGIGTGLARQWFQFTVPNDNCAPLDKQSWLGLLASVSAARMGSDPKGMLGYWMSTETHRCDRGNQRLADALAHDLQDLRLSSPVVKLEVERDFIDPIFITSAAVTPTRVTHVRENYHLCVLATSPTVWPGVNIDPRFDPDDYQIQHGPAVKFMSRYSTEFWVPAGLAPSAKWDQRGSVWEGTDNQPGPPAFDLTVYAGGPLGTLGAPAYAGALSTLYPTGTPTGTLFADWPTEPFIMTGYGIPGLKDVTEVGPKQQLPYRDSLYIAGEQTSMGFFGYMEGALQSGARAARDIVRAQKERCDGSRDA